MPTEPYLASIMPFAGNFVPRGFAACAGQLMQIRQNAALYALLGTTYGGDGRTTFALPDLRSVAPAHPGQGSGLQALQLGTRNAFVPAQGATHPSAVTVARDMLQGSTGRAVSAPRGPEPQTAIQYVIALQGVFPQRS